MKELFLGVIKILKMEVCQKSKILADFYCFCLVKKNYFNNSYTLNKSIEMKFCKLEMYIVLFSYNIDLNN